MEEKIDWEAEDINLKINYEPEADVLTIETSPAPIDYAKEVGNVVVHFTRNNQPVLVEIMEASKSFALLLPICKNSTVM